MAANRRKPAVWAEIAFCTGMPNKIAIFNSNKAKFWRREFCQSSDFCEIALLRNRALFAAFSAESSDFCEIAKLSKGKAKTCIFCAKNENFSKNVKNATRPLTFVNIFTILRRPCVGTHEMRKNCVFSISC